MCVITIVIIQAVKDWIAADEMRSLKQTNLNREFPVQPEKYREIAILST
jgi:hypothetical protein